MTQSPIPKAQIDASLSVDSGLMSLISYQSKLLFSEPAWIIGPARMAGHPMILWTRDGSRCFVDLGGPADARPSSAGGLWAVAWVAGNLLRDGPLPEEKLLLSTHRIGGVSLASICILLAPNNLNCPKMCLELMNSLGPGQYIIVLTVWIENPDRSPAHRVSTASASRSFRQAFAAHSLSCLVLLAWGPGDRLEGS